MYLFQAAVALDPIGLVKGIIYISITPRCNYLLHVREWRSISSVTRFAL